MDEFAPVCKFTYMQNNLHMCKFGHENGALVKPRDLNIELLTISMDNIWKFCGLELQDILIQQEFIFMGKYQTNIPEMKKDIYHQEFNFEHWQASCNLLIWYLELFLLVSNFSYGTAVSMVLCFQSNFAAIFLI